MRKTYDQMHSGLHWARGKASEFECPCGKPAKHWSYMHSAGDRELTSERGSPYSEDFSDYEPLCIGCHRRFEISQNPRVQKAMRENLRAGDGWRVLEARRQTDPEVASRLHAIRSENGKRNSAVANAIRRTCTECGLVSNPAGVGRHHKFSGHRGHEDA